tara:strand:- start:30 stop:698 length:669 start_codon:yes stop_codon:yes gene_type:complete
MGKSMKVQYKKKTMKKRKSSGKKHMRKNTKRRTIKKKGRKMSCKSSRKSSRKYKRNSRMRGGSTHGPVGYSWNGGDVGTWPGVQASQGMNTNGATMSNHFSLSPNGIVVGGIEPAVSTSDDQLINSSSVSMSGGKKKNKRMRSKKQKGGLGFQSIVNLGRGLEAGAKGVYYNYTGQQQPNSDNPFPTQNQYAHNNNNTQTNNNNLPDIRGSYVKANDTVAKI